MEWYETQDFWIHIFALCMIILLSLMFNYLFKRKTNPLFVAATQLVLPAIILGAAELISKNWAFIGIDGLVILGLYGIFNYSYFWYNSHRKFDEEKYKENNFIGQEPDRDAFCRVYIPKYDITGEPAYIYFEKHYNIVKSFINRGLLNDVIDDFYRCHPELTREERPQITVSKPPEETEARKQWEKEQIEQAQQAEDWEKATILKMLRQVLEGWNLWIIYYRWQWMLTPKGMEDADLRSNIKEYMLSVCNRLPPSLICNVQGLGEEEIEDNKTFTVLFSIEGVRSAVLLERMNVLTANLQIFRIFQFIAYIERLQQQITALRIKSQNEVLDFENIMKEKAVIDTRQARMRALASQTMPKSVLERLKEQSEVTIQ